VNDGRFYHDEAGALRQHCRATEDDNEPEAHPLHWFDPAPRQPETSELRQPGGNSNASGCKKATGDRVNDQKQDCRQEVAEQLPESLFQRCLSFIGYPTAAEFRGMPRASEVQSD
jgi:hypothetical protein